MPAVAKFAASAAAAASPAAAGAAAGASLAAPGRPGETRPLTLRFAGSAVDVRTRVPAGAASGDELNVAQLRDILLNRGLLSCAEHATFFDAMPVSVRGEGAPPRPLGESHRIDTDAVWVLQEAPH